MLGYEPARPSLLPKAQIQKIAESASFKLRKEKDSDLFDVVEAMGGSVSIEETLLADPTRAGSLFVDGPGKFKIIVPSHTSPERDQFTIAHEFGHYVLHYLWQKARDPEYPDRIYALRRGSDRIEWEANWFAASFLMPEKQFESVFQEYSGNLSRIADHFFVSFKAAEIRARDIIGA